MVGTYDRGMGRKSTAKQRIVNASTALFYSRSFSDVSTAEICQHAGVLPGSLYHFFDSKHDVGLAVIQEHAKQLRESLIRPSLTSNGKPLDRLRQMLLGVASQQKQHAERSGQVLGSPVGNLAVELSTILPEFRERLGEIFCEWTKALETILAEAEAEGHLRPGLDPSIAALIALAQIEGILVLSKVLNNPSLIETIIEDFTLLLSHAKSEHPS
jgi:TetR/AcrR family transcriptional regulator, transcriptional repressor for nem operon